MLDRAEVGRKRSRFVSKASSISGDQAKRVSRGVEMRSGQMEARLPGTPNVLYARK